MAKNMNSRDFRKIDIDALDEDKYKDEEEDGNEIPGLGPDENEIIGALSSNRLEAALTAALKNPPLKTKNKQSKNRAVILVCKVLNQHKIADIEKAVLHLNTEDSDLLLKYIYAGFERPGEVNCANLLAWHSVIIKHRGRGPIVRVFTDPKRL